MSSVPPLWHSRSDAAGRPSCTSFSRCSPASASKRAWIRTYGIVSAIKLCRSVVIKGMEALAIEGLLAARTYGVED